MQRRILPRDVSSVIGRHEGNVSGLLISFILDKEILKKNRADALSLLWNMGYTADTAKHALSCAEKCVKFADQLHDQGYLWDNSFGIIVRKKEKVTDAS